MVHSTVGFIVLVTDIGDMNIGDKIYILSPWYSHENGGLPDILDMANFDRNWPDFEEMPI